MELEAIFWARLRALRTHTASHHDRISTLEGRSTQSSQTSAGHWLKKLSDLTIPLGGIIGFLARHWGVITLVATTIWTGLRWLLRALHIG